MEREEEQVEGGKGGIHGDGRRLTRGDEHTMQCTHDVLSNCMPKTCMILLTDATPIHSIF